MVNVNKLKSKIVEKGLTIDAVAQNVGIDKSTFYRKLNEKGGKFLICEAKSIAYFLQLTNEEAIAIFFADSVA